MGLSFRKSISLGKGLKVNIGKGGIGLSAGVKGARVSINKNGVGGSIGANGVRYSKRKSFKSMQNDMQSSNVDMPIGNNIPVQNNVSESYTKHIILLASGFMCFILGLFFLPLVFIAIILFISSIVCMIKNWTRINEEYKIRKNK